MEQVYNAYTYDSDSNRLAKKYYDPYDQFAMLNFKGFGSDGAFDASNRLMEVSGNIGTRVNVTGTVSNLASDMNSVWVIPNDDDTKRVQVDIVDGMWIAKGVELLDSANNSVYVIVYDDAGNTATDIHDTISLDDASITYTYDSKGNLTQRQGRARRDARRSKRGTLVKRTAAEDTMAFAYYQNGLLYQDRWCQPFGFISQLGFLLAPSSL